MPTRPTSSPSWTTSRSRWPSCGPGCRRCASPNSRNCWPTKAPPSLAHRSRPCWPTGSPARPPSDRVRRTQLRGQSLPGPHRRDDGQGMDRQAGHGLGRGSDRPDERSPELEHRLHHAARPSRRHVAADHLPAGPGSQRTGETHRGHSGDHAGKAELLRWPRDVLVAGQPDSRRRCRRAARPHRAAAPAAARRRAVRSATQAAAPVPARHHRADHRPRLGRRA